MRYVFMFLVVFLHQAAVTMLSEKQLQIIKYGNDAAETLKKNVYVDGSLKSVNTR